MAQLPSNSAHLAPPCPACGLLKTRHLDAVSKDATVDFFDCRACHHLWAVDKRDPSKVRHVTPLPHDKPDSFKST